MHGRAGHSASGLAAAVCADSARSVDRHSGRDSGQCPAVVYGIRRRRRPVQGCGGRWCWRWRVCQACAPMTTYSSELCDMCIHHICIHLTTDSQFNSGVYIFLVSAAHIKYDASFSMSDNNCQTCVTLSTDLRENGCPR